MYLFFDTETTGLPDYKEELTSDKQPHILQLACVVMDDNRRELISWKAPIRLPFGVQVDEDGYAFNVNKISQKMIDDYGVSMEHALAMFKSFEKKCLLKIAYNYRFDGFLLKVAHERNGIKPMDPPIDRYDPMRAISKVMKQPPTEKMIADGFGGKPKSAKLVDAYKYCTGKDPIDAHDALADVRMMIDVFFWIKDNGHFEHQERKAA